MRPSLHHLEYFVAVADEGQFTQAADRLHVAQPSVSAQIRRLERLLGTTLFHRGPGPVTLTDAGKELLPLARRALVDLDEVVFAVGEINGIRRGHVAIGATPSLSMTLLPAVLAGFHQRHPGISLTVAELGSNNLVDGLKSGTLDLALAAVPPGSSMFEREVLAVEELVVLTSVDHDLAGREHIGIEDLAGVPMVMFREGYTVRAATIAAFFKAGVEPVVAIEGGEMRGVLSLVAAGLGVAIVPSIVATTAPGLHILRLESALLEREIGLLRRQDRVLSRAAAALSHEITTFLAERGWPGTTPPGFRIVPPRVARR